MKNYYILVAADEDKARLSRPSAYQLAAYRLANKRWGLNSRTRNRKAITTGDEVLIYAAGRREHGMCFVGRATITSDPEPLKSGERTRINSPVESALAVASDYGITLGKEEIFASPVPIKMVYRQMSWVRNPDSVRWGAALMGGALRIGQQDFDLVIKVVRKGVRQKSPQAPTLPLLVSPAEHKRKLYKVSRRQP